MQSCYQPTIPLSVVRINLSCAFLKTFFGDRFSRYERNKNFQNILVLAKEEFTTYAVKKKELFRKLLSLDFLHKRDRKRILSLMRRNSKKEGSFELEISECEEIIGEI